VSIPGTPPALASWYQAQQACALSGKHLLTNEEWQRAADGTPDPGPGGSGLPSSCNHFADWPPYPTGSRPQCVSNWGVYDMVGNFAEWSADWVHAYAPLNPSPTPPAALLEGFAGARSPAQYPPAESPDGIGFRCAR
jgi:formylglycine-generating enzyme required for sulfatase activity